MNMKRILHAGTTYVFALLFIAAGIFHMIEPSGFIRMMSSWPCCYFYQMSGAQRQNLLSCALQTYLLREREYYAQVKNAQNEPCYV